MIDAERLIRQRLREQYAQGLQDGMIITLDMIEGTNLDDNVGVPYQGPLPDELREYIARVRRRAASGDDPQEGK